MFFSDVVVAIALTLLALELPVPEGDTSRDVVHAMGEAFGEYLAFLISFVVIASHWRSHHGFFRTVHSVSAQVVGLNLVWLFLTVITPFTTKLLSLGQMNGLRFSVYAATRRCNSGCSL